MVETAGAAAGDGRDDAGGSEDTAGGRVVLGTTEADAMGRGAAVAGGSAAAIVVSGPARGGVSTGAGRRITTTTPTRTTTAAATPSPTRSPLRPPCLAGGAATVGRVFEGTVGEATRVGAAAGAVGGTASVSGVTAVRVSSIVGTSWVTGGGAAVDLTPASSAAANAPADGQRSSGFLAAALRSGRTSASGTSDGAGRGIGSWTCFIMMASGVSAEKGTHPVNIW